MCETYINEISHVPHVHTYFSFCFLIVIFFLLICLPYIFFFFFFNDTATTEIYTLSLHDALPIWYRSIAYSNSFGHPSSEKPAPYISSGAASTWRRSEEHTPELQSPCNLVCRLLLEKKKNRQTLLLTIKK